MKENDCDQINHRQGPPDRRQDNWYTNKELFEKIQLMNEKVTDKIDNVQKDLATKINDLQNDVRKYNNLNGKIETLVNNSDKNATAITETNSKLDIQISKCNQVQSNKEGQRSVADLIKNWWPIILATLLGISGLLKGCGAF